MTTQDDHGQLPYHADRLIGHLESIRSRFLPSRVGHQQHNEFAERSALLADQLRAALLLTEHAHYAPGFTTIRTALEHHLIDRLLFLANRYLQVYSIKKADIAAEEARLAALQAGPRPDISRWEVVNGRFNVVVRGLYPSGSLGRGRTLSPYFFVINQYDPFTGRPRDVGRLAGAFNPIGLRRKWAEESRAVWDSLFVYAKLRRNLLLNHLITNPTALQLDVHYGFLSAFAHAMNPAYRLVYGRNQPASIGAHDHYASELQLLYAVTIASAELAAFARMASRTPRLRLAWDPVAADLAAAHDATAYFWFLHGGPQRLDRINEVHTRLARRRALGRLTPVDPMSLPPSRVRYYTNPLARLVELHRGFQELSTGITSQPLFPRADASWRI